MDHSEIKDALSWVPSYVQVREKTRKIIQNKEDDYYITLSQFLKVIPDDLYYVNLPLDELDISVRSYNALRRNGVHNVCSLLQLSIEKLDQMRNLGINSLAEIVCACDTFCKGHNDEARQNWLKRIVAGRNTDWVEEAIIYSWDTNMVPDKELFIKTFSAFFRLNHLGQEVAAETIAGLTNVEKLKIKDKDSCEGAGESNEEK